MASELDKLQKVGIGTATTLSAPGKAAAATSITVGSTANFPTTTGITFAIRVVDGNGELVAGTYTEWVGTVTSGTTLAMNAVPVYGSDQVYTAGSTTQVYMPLSSYSYNKMIDGLLAEHEQLDGKHKTTLITARTEDTTPDVGADFLLSYDTSAAALKKVKPSNLGLATGWISGQLPAVSSVTENGNRSADITFASTVASILTPGMRIRTSRTVAAPTQSTSLNGTTQYYSKTTPNKLTFTDDFVVSAWVKLESYANGIIASRYNGTSGWYLYITSAGLIQFTGHNAGAGNASYVSSYQALPLNKWVHIACQLDMSAFTATTTTSYIMIDGVDVPASVTRIGTNPTALVQAGNLEIGAYNGGSLPFDGKIAQVAIYSAKVTQATIKASMNQGLSGSETSLVSAYSFNNSIVDLNTTTPNDLTANGGAVATNADSPFTVDANGTPGGTYDFGIVTKVVTTVATVQYPEGCGIATSGGISTVDYSGVKAPFGMPVSEDRWTLDLYNSASDFTQNTPTAGTYYNPTGLSFSTPVGDYKLTTQYVFEIRDDVGTPSDATRFGFSSSASAFSQRKLQGGTYSSNSGTSVFSSVPATYTSTISNSTATTYYGIMVAGAGTFTVIQFKGSMGPITVTAVPAYL